MTTQFDSEQKAKLTQIINEGMGVMSEVEALNEGLNDTVKSIAEELQIKPSVLKKAIRIAHKASYTAEKEDQQLLDEILTTAGRTL
jgi:hypothetical protein|tara:strand:- start:4852 stop:5109 length:258 start_codon:yes stop_codon:yes gene_type:complete